MVGFCFFAAASVWIAAFILGKWNEKPISIPESLNLGFRELADVEAAKEYLKDSAPKIRSFLRKGMAFLPEELKEQVKNFIATGGSWKICSLSDEIYPVIRTVFVVLFIK